ncbi:hypothetical protein GCM10020000_44310 [Streptomyces olivoverticillatus]
MIQACDSVSWNGPLAPGAKRTSCTAASTSVASENASAVHLAAVRRAAGDGGRGHRAERRDGRGERQQGK